MSGFMYYNPPFQTRQFAWKRCDFGHADGMGVQDEVALNLWKLLLVLESTFIGFQGRGVQELELYSEELLSKFKGNRFWSGMEERQSQPPVKSWVNLNTPERDKSMSGKF